MLHARLAPCIPTPLVTMLCHLSFSSAHHTSGICILRFEAQLRALSTPYPVAFSARCCDCSAPDADSWWTEMDLHDLQQQLDRLPLPELIRSVQRSATHVIRFVQLAAASIIQLKGNNWRALAHKRRLSKSAQMLRGVQRMQRCGGKRRD